MSRTGLRFQPSSSEARRAVHLAPLLNSPADVATSLEFSTEEEIFKTRFLATMEEDVVEESTPSGKR